VVRAGLTQGLATADRVFLVLRYLESPTRLGGSKRSFGISEVLWVAGLSLRAQGASSSPSGLGGSRLRGVVGEHSKGEETQESIGRWRGATRVSSERIREGKKASKQVKLAKSGGFIA